MRKKWKNLKYTENYFRFLKKSIKFDRNYKRISIYIQKKSLILIENNPEKIQKLKNIGINLMLIEINSSNF